MTDIPSDPQVPVAAHPRTSRLSLLALLLTFSPCLLWSIVFSADPGGYSPYWDSGAYYDWAIPATYAIVLAAILVGIASLIRIHRAKGRLKGVVISSLAIGIAAVEGMCGALALIGLAILVFSGPP